MNDNIFTLKEFAKRIKVGRLTVMKMIKQGKIIAFRVSDAPKSPYRIRESEIDRLISFELNKKIINEGK
jgi:excisionase family DNA binding protein